ncbi:MAG: nickel-dependent hydrogenase large subunit [Rhodospirillales bacterium]|nr:nickel-dependent hydrogenase large subunit [Rhodospirillales bacterium]
MEQRFMSSRTLVSAQDWQAAARSCAAGDKTLVALWGEIGFVHMALCAPDGSRTELISCACPDGTFPSVARIHTPADRLERAITDLCGLRPDAGHDARAWLDHGRWGVSHPLGARGPAAAQVFYEFLPVQGESLHQIPVGPVHAGIIEPGHFRFTAQGETVVRLEQRLGYVHKGIESLMAGADIARGAQIAARISGDSTVAYGWAFASAVEHALRLDVPPRARYLRALMAEMERVANHLGDIGAICNDGAFALMLAHCGVLRERVLRTAAACFGHRMMQGCIVPGGVATGLDAQGTAAIRGLVKEIGEAFPDLIDLYDNTASLQDRTVGTGALRPDLAARFGAGGVVGRASGRAVDVRRTPGYAPYESLKFEVPVRAEGDVNARVWVRILEVEQSLSLIGQILDALPAGKIRVDVPPVKKECEGFAVIEGFRGDVFVWLRIGADGTILRCHPRDPSWFQWPLLENVIKDNIVADFPLCNKSFNCSYSGHDL